MYGNCGKKPWQVLPVCSFHKFSPFKNKCPGAFAQTGKISPIQKEIRDYRAFVRHMQAIHTIAG